tara:strand:- start:233 stop:1033 length:801 start_codon:yes stop_codon:yes gene_type:complete
MDVSDSARQLAAMCQWFAGYQHNKSNSRGIDAVERFLKSNGRSETIKILAETSKRFDEYEELVSSVEDGLLDEIDKSDAIEAARRVRKFLDFDTMMSTWSTYIAIAGDQANLYAIRLPSGVLRQIRPCLVPSEKDVSDLSLALAEISEDDIQDARIPDLFRQAIRYGVEELQLGVRYPLIYGLEKIPNKAAQLTAQLRMAAELNPAIKNTDMWGKCYRALGLALTLWLGYQPLIESTKYNISDIKYLVKEVDEIASGLILDVKKSK